MGFFPDDHHGMAHYTNILKFSGVLVIAHLQGIRILNEIHRKVGGVVKEDRIPPFNADQIRSTHKK